MAHPVRSFARVRSRWGIVLLSVLIMGVFGAGAARAAGTPVPGSPVASGPDCLVLYRGYFPPAAPGSACFNIITASADAPPVDVSVDGVKVVEHQAYAADVVNAIYAVPSGTPRFQVTAAGDPVAKALLNKKVKLAPGQVYEIVIYDRAAAMRIKVFQVDVSPLPADGSRVRIINATHDDGTIDGFLVQGPQSIDQALKIANIKFGRASKYRELTWETDVTGLSVTSVPAGTAPPNDIGHVSGGGPGDAVSFILVGQDGRLGTYVSTRWTVAASA